MKTKSLSKWLVKRSIWIDSITRFIGGNGWTKDVAQAKRFKSKRAATMTANRYCYAEAVPDDN